MKVISSRDNQHIKNCLKLKQKKYRDDTKLYVVEGQRIYDEVTTYSSHSIKQVFVVETEVAKYNFTSLSADIFIINDKLMQEISDTTSPSGILAILEKPIWDIETVKQEGKLLVLLDNIADPGNVGTIIRTSAAFDVDGLFLNKGCVDPYNHKVVRATMGGILHLPIFANITISDILDFKNAGYMLVGTSLDNAINYYEYDFTSPTILVIGSEAFGISLELLNKCDKLVKIPINPAMDSLNAGVACGIILSEARK
ncbi:MAG: RNA methyltransferase [Syntrophomonadaceae bacterium]|nr:RNA methyltransferase [Syntrophomonadaceae bacterium]